MNGSRIFSITSIFQSVTSHRRLYQPDEATVSVYEPWVAPTLPAMSSYSYSTMVPTTGRYIMLVLL